jgi:hypothetical protein
VPDAETRDYLLQDPVHGVTARFITVMIGDSEKRLGVKGLGFSSS